MYAVFEYVRTYVFEYVTYAYPKCKTKKGH